MALTQFSKFYDYEIMDKIINEDTEELQTKIDSNLFDTILQPQMMIKIMNYGKCKEILHTIFYGTFGNGKYTLAKMLIAKNMNVSLRSVEKIQKHIFMVKDKEYYFYKSNVHFEIDLKNFLTNQQKVIIEIIQDLSKTLNVSLNRYKIILIKNSELLERNIQHQLRRMMETLYKTCRIIFLCHNIDRLDDTIQSRLVLLNIHSPDMNRILPIIKKMYNDNISENILKENILDSNYNVSVSYFKLVLNKLGITNEIDHFIKHLWKYINKQTNPIQLIRKILRIITITQVEWEEIVFKLIHKIFKTFQKKHSVRSEILSYTNYYIYMYNIGYRKEFQLELLLITLHLYLKKRNTSPSYKFNDWL